MSLNQFGEFYNLHGMHLQLQRFGLNPKDWRIKLTSSEYPFLEMVHREDRDFRFNAALERTSRGEFKVDQLTLISL